MKITLLSEPLGSYPIVLKKGATATENFAADELRSYVYKLTGDSLDVTHDGERGLILGVDEPENDLDDGFTIEASGKSLRLTGRNGRGLIYCVYEFVERMGYRFFSAEFAGKGYERGDYMAAEEYLFDDSDKTIDDGFYLRSSPAMYYRDAFTYAASHDRDALKFRLNAETWGLRRLSEEWGGGHKFCGAAGHSFSALLRSAVYFDDHPDFFAEIDGKRVKNESESFLAEPQFCLTNDGLVDFVAEKMLGMLRENPAEFISLSQSDSDLFCECEKCRESYAKYGYFGTLLRFVNAVAERIGAEFPTVKVHTYCYERTADVDGRVKAAPNVLIQYCPRPCHRHALSDPTCEPNARVLARLKTLGKIGGELFVYDYRSCLGHALMMLPDIRCLREQMRCYADVGVKGIYAEANIFTALQPTMEELRLYLFAKLCWNPYMSEDEYNRHIDEFLEGFYGRGWRRMREFIDVYQDEATNYHVDSFEGTMAGDDCRLIRKADGNLDRAVIFPRETAASVLARLNALLTAAEEESGGENSRYFERIEIVRVGLLWYELFIGMDEILARGSDEEKAAVVKKNELLCRKMRHYRMKYTTFIGMSPTTRMYENYSLSPSKWVPESATDSKAFNFDTYPDLANA